MANIGYAQMLMSTIDTGPTYIAGATAVASTSNFQTTTTNLINTTGANFISYLVCWYPGFGGPAMSIADSKGNTYSTAILVNGTNTQFILYYKFNPVVGASHSFSISCFGGSPVLIANCYNTSLTSLFSTTSAVSTAFGTTIQPGPITSNGLFISACTTVVAAPLSVNSGYTILQQYPAAGTYYTTGFATVYSSSSVTKDPLWTIGTLYNNRTVLQAVFT